MPPEFFSILDRLGSGSSVTMDADQTVFRQGDAVRWFYRIVNGRVRLSRILARGSEIALARADSGEILAEASMFAKHYHCDAIAEVRVELQRFPIRDIRELLNTRPEAAKGYAFYLATKLMDLRAVAEIRAIRRADDRLLAWLQLRARGNPPILEAQGSWTSVARQIGLTRESLYRALATLERERRVKRIGDRTMLT